MKTLTLKRGSTFAANATYTPTPSAPNLGGISITSEVRTPFGQPVTTLTVVPAPDDLGFSTAPVSTASWPLGTLHWDLKFTRDGVVFYSETLAIEIQREVTA